MKCPMEYLTVYIGLQHKYNQHGSKPTATTTTTKIYLSFLTLLWLFLAQRHLWAVCKDFQLQQSMQNETRRF
jgi:hypothetical protein